MNYLKIFILVILISIAIGSWCNVMADDIIQDNFIEIPSYLTEGVKEEIVTNSIGLECTGCLDFCEVYDECCNYENCQGTCQTCLGCEGGCQSCQTTCESSCQNCEGVACQTSQAPTNPADNASLSISGISYTYFTATVTGINNPTAISLHTKFYINNVFDGGVFSTTVSSVDHVYSGLSEGTTYSVKVTVENTSTGQIYKTFTRTVTTNEQQTPKLPNPTLDTSKTIKTANSIKVTISTQSNVNKHYFRINNGTIINNGVVANYMFTNLSPNTQYLIEIKVGGTGYEDSDWVGYYATTLEAVLWEWHYAKTSGIGFNVTPAEWLAFCNKINEVRVAKGLSAYSFTTSSTYIGKDKPFYAWIWLQAANAINDLGTGVASACLSVNSGDIIYPWYFDNLKTALNNAIPS